MLKKYYMDHAATSFPKAPNVASAITEYIEGVGASINRGAYAEAYAAENKVYETRELICQLFGTCKAENVVFTKNITESLNLLLKSLLKAGDHVIVSAIEHNAVMRPLNWLRDNRGISYDVLPCDSKGHLILDQLEPLIQPHTKLVLMTHASNVSGTILDLKAVGKICHEKNIFFAMDTAQTAGILDIKAERYHADAIAFTGHKGLLGPQGIGGILLSDSILSAMDSFIQGGTGSLSEMETQPDYMPDRFESGTQNLPGIYGLHAALKYLLAKPPLTIRDHELLLTRAFMYGISQMSHVFCVGPDRAEEKMAVCSIVFKDRDQGEVAYLLDKEFGIMTRCGLHCAPSAHKTLGTFPEGTVRFSFGYHHSLEDIYYALDAIEKIALL